MKFYIYFLKLLEQKWNRLQFYEYQMFLYKVTQLDDSVNRIIVQCQLFQYVELNLSNRGIGGKMVLKGLAEMSLSIFKWTVCFFHGNQCLEKRCG